MCGQSRPVQLRLRPRPSGAAVLNGIGGGLLVVAVIGMIAATAVYLSGNDLALLGAIAAFALGTTGVGVLAAVRNTARRGPA